MSSNKRATEDDLSELHGVVAKVLKVELTKDRSDPETGQKLDVPAALLAQAINFLKANGINAVPTSPALRSIVDSLPFSQGDDDSEDHHPAERRAN